MIRVRSKKGQRLVKIGLVIFYLLLMALMFLLGRSHTVLIDNKSDPNGAYKAIDKIMLRGQTHRVKVSFFNGQEEITGTITIPLFEDAVMVSIPAFVKGENAVSHFELYTPSEE